MIQDTQHYQTVVVICYDKKNKALLKMMVIDCTNWYNIFSFFSENSLVTVI